MAPHGKELSEDLNKKYVALHKDGVGFKKIAKTMKLSCSMAAKTIQDRFHSEQASPWSTKEVECTCSASYPEVCFGNRRMSMSAASITAEVEGVWVSLPVLRPYAAHCIKLVCMAVVPEGSRF